MFANIFCAILQLKQENWKIVWMEIKNRGLCLESIQRRRAEPNLTSYSNLFSHSRDCVFDIPGNKKSGSIVSKSLPSIFSLTREIRKRLRHKFHPASTLMRGWEHNSRIYQMCLWLSIIPRIPLLYPFATPLQLKHAHIK